MSFDPEHKWKPEGLQGSAGGQLIRHLPAGSPCWHVVAGVAAAAPPPECKTTQLLLHFCLLRLAQNPPGAQLSGSAERMEIWAVSSVKPSGHIAKPP